MGHEYTIGNTLVSMTGVSKSLSGKLIIRGIGTEQNPLIIPDISRPGIKQGQTIGVVGASGSGKSTLFKLLTGIYSPTTGNILIPDEKKTGEYRSVRGGDVGFVQQSYPLSRNQTVYQMLRDAAAQGGIPRKDRDTIIDSYLETWGLKNEKFKSPKQLSGGQKQRVAVIEQFLCSHHFIVLDEPFSGLDVKNIEDVKNSFEKISTSDELNTIFFSTHDIHLAVELSDLIFVVGYERDQEGKKIPGGTIVGQFNLMEMGLSWNDTYTPQHRELAGVIENIIKSS